MTRRPRHYLKFVDEDQRLADCSICGPGAVISRHGAGRWRCAKSRGTFAPRSSSYVPLHRVTDGSCRTCGPRDVLDGVCKSRRAHMGEPEWAVWFADEAARVARLEDRAESKRRKSEERALRERRRIANRLLREPVLHMHRIVERDLEAMTAVCVMCGPTRLRAKRSGTKVAYVCAIARPRRRKGNRDRRGSVCEGCGLVPEHSSGLELDHVDGNWRNNDASNLWTLCGTCHNIKTAYEQGHFVLRGLVPRVIVALSRR